MANSYVDSFGMIHYLGVGSGRDELCDASAKPDCGLTKHLEIIVDANGPVENVGSSFGRGAACLPKGAYVTNAYLETIVKGSASGITVNMVRANGTDAQVLFAATTPAGNATVDVVNTTDAANVISVIFPEDRYVKVGGTRTGYKGKLHLEFI